MPKLPWTLLIFREKEILWTSTIEMLADTFVFLCAYLAMWFLFATVFYMAVSNKSTRWLWPDLDHSASYGMLVFFYLLLIGIACYQMTLYQEADCLAFVFLLPVGTFFGSYLIFERQRIYERLKAWPERRSLDTQRPNKLQPADSHPVQNSHAATWHDKFLPESHLVRHCLAAHFFWILFAVLPAIGMTLSTMRR
jgi:hypothetical protein